MSENRTASGPATLLGVIRLWSERGEYLPALGHACFLIQLVLEARIPGRDPRRGVRPVSELIELLHACNPDFAGKSDLVLRLREFDARYSRALDECPGEAYQSVNLSMEPYVADALELAQRVLADVPVPAPMDGA